MNKKGFIGILVFILCFLVVAFMLFIILEPRTHEYKYIGKIIDMEGGSSRSVLILELDTIGKTPYTTRRHCSNKIRIGQEVYSKGDYLWVKYAEDRYC